MFIPSFERGGVERNVLNLTHGLVESKVSIDLILSQSSSSMLSELPENVRVLQMGTSRVASAIQRHLTFLSTRVIISLVTWWGLIQYIRRERPDVLISFQSSVLAVWASLLTKTQPRLIVREAQTPTVALASTNQLTAKLITWLKRRTYSKADFIVANSMGAAKDLAKLLNLPQERITVIHNPSFTTTVVDQSKEALDHPWFEPGQPPVILGVGRLTDQKDFETLLKAFALVRQVLESRMVILGEGNKRPQLEQLARKLGAWNDVDLYGFVKNPYKYMVRASVFALSSRWEGLPNALIEAVGLGTPVVSTNCPSGPSEILINGAAGPLVAVGDVEALADAIINVLTNAEQTKRNVGVGQMHINRFSPNVGIRKWLQVIGLQPKHSID